MSGEKHCERCGAAMTKPPKYSRRQWSEKRFCSRRCGAWNLGMTKYDDPRMTALAEIAATSAVGRTPWNKGLNKHQDIRVAAYGEKISDLQRGRKPSAKQLASLELGRRWSLGLTNDTSQSLAARSKAGSITRKGRKNPEHSARMVAFYAKHPERHPNALLAKKTRGIGHTHIEKIVSELLVELGIEADFNRRVGRKWVDFAIYHAALAIEADGEHWHQDEEKERIRDAYLSEYGWRILHLTGSDIVAKTSDCKLMIAACMGMKLGPDHVR